MAMTKENLPARNFGATRSLTAIDTVVIHHTGGGKGGLLPTLRDRGLSYHYAIQPNGDIIQFTKPQTTAFHARHLNPNSIGIAFVGNFTNTEPTIEAYHACTELIKTLNLPNLKEIVGHGERMATACPAMENVQLLSDRFFASKKSTHQFPISDYNINRMVELGVMQSPDYWRSVSLEWLDTLLTNAGQTGNLDPRIKNGITDPDTAIETLAHAGILTNKLYWQTQTLPHLDQLLLNIANQSRNPLERIIHAEAQGEDLEGQILVGNVILNRSNHPNFPTDIHNVIFEQGQFSPITDVSYASANPSAQVKQAVCEILNGTDHSKGATHFHAVGSGRWHKQAVAEGRLEWLFPHGNHIFYKEV